MLGNVVRFTRRFWLAMAILKKSANVWRHFDLGFWEICLGRGWKICFKNVYCTSQRKVQTCKFWVLQFPKIQKEQFAFLTSNSSLNILILFWRNGKMKSILTDKHFNTRTTLKESCSLGKATEDWGTLLVLLARKILVPLFEQTLGGILLLCCFQLTGGICSQIVL